jgi:prolycopene isomerase
MKDNYDVIIIGAGMGGLTSAAWLTHMGMKVLVIEQNIQPGGCCSSYRREEYNFTPAASIITGATKKNGLFDRMISKLGIDIDFIPLDRGYHIHLPDFDYYLYSGGEHAKDQLIEELTRIFPYEAEGLKKFFRVLVKINDQMDYATFLGTRPKDIARILLKCPTLAMNASKGILPFADNFVKDPKLKSVLSINSTCCNLPPSRMSLLGIVGLLVEGGLSNPHVVGGAQAVPDAFVKYLREQGSDVVMGTMADKILMEGKKAVGVRVQPSSIAMEKEFAEGISEAKEIKAKYVISNAAARQTFEKLVGEQNLPSKFIKNLKRMEPTPTFCALFLGLNMDLKNMGYIPALHVHSSTYDTDEHFRNIENKIANENVPDPFFRFQLAPLSDPTSAPEGKTAFVMHSIPAPISGWDGDLEKRTADVMVKRAEKVIPGLSQHIEYQEFCSPVKLDKYLMCGQDASLGWALTPKQTGPKRLSPKTPVKNLFLSGHWTAPAVGVMSTVISGLQTARMILANERVDEPLLDVGIKDGIPV